RSLEARYRSAEGLATDLRRFQTGQLVGAHRYTAWELAKRWIGKYRAILATAAAALVVLAVLGVISVRRIARERDEANTERGLARQNEAVGNERFASSLHEVARQAMVAGSPDRALALMRGDDRHTGAAELTRSLAVRAYAGLVGLAPPQAKFTTSA